MEVVIVGAPGAGKSTVFDALSGPNASVRSTSQGNISMRMGVVQVPDERLDWLAGIFNPKKVVKATFTFTDLGGVRPKGGGGGLPADALNSLKRADALALVTGTYAHQGDGERSRKEIDEFVDEFVFHDLTMVDKRYDMLAQGKIKGEPGEKELLGKLKGALEEGRPLTDLDLTETELRSIRSYSFLSLVPLIVLVNLSEGETEPPNEAAARCKDLGKPLLAFSALVERELAELPPEERDEFLKELGVEKALKDAFIQAAYRLLGLISFLTVGPDEVRAWPIREGTKAHDAAGAVHSDISRGFIRAETIHYDEVRDLGSLAKAKEQGKLRQEGKEYIVRDGDIINYKFNV